MQPSQTICCLDFFSCSDTPLCLSTSTKFTQSNSIQEHHHCNNVILTIYPRNQDFSQNQLWIINSHSCCKHSLKCLNVVSVTTEMTRRPKTEPIKLPKHQEGPSCAWSVSHFDKVQLHTTEQSSTPQ